jgi:tRNA threonylcarbamoyladenosine biosynthesis protein TsaE
MKITINNQKELELFAKKIAKKIKPGDFFLLDGDLGAGKTTFVAAIMKTFKTDDVVCSPSFTIINRYSSKFSVYHIDLYRISSDNELYDMDMDNYFNKKEAVFFIEWAERMGQLKPENRLELRFSYSEDNGSFDKRELEIIAIGSSYERFLK